MIVSRRSLLKGVLAVGAATTAGIPVIASAQRTHVVPRTVIELKDAINTLFHPIGKSCRAWEQLGDQQIKFSTYVTGVRKDEAEDFPVSAFYTAEYLAVAAAFAKILEIRRNPFYGWSEECIEMHKGDAPACASRVYWRLYPELVTHENGLFAVRLRAAFI